MIIKSIFDYGQEIPQPNTCNGLNVSPPLFFEEVPEDAKSLVLLFEDIDASPKPKTHWLVYNIPVTTVAAQQGTTPEGATEGLAYEGPCPKDFEGIHHFWFRLFALDALLDLPAGAARDEVEAAMHEHIVAKAELVGLCNSHSLIFQ